MTTAVNTPRALSELIGLVYDAATDLSVWPELLDGIAGYLQQPDEQTPQLDPTRMQELLTQWFEHDALPDENHVSGELQLLALLAPHFVRANALHRELTEAEEGRALLESALDRLPLGMAIVDRDGRIAGMNRALLEITRHHPLLRIEGGLLRATPPQRLQDALHQVIDRTARSSQQLHLDTHSDDALSILVSHMVFKGQREQAGRAVVFVASRALHQLSETSLITAYGLTPAEAQLTQGLVRGRTLEQLAAERTVTIHTTRAQLKSVFAKVGVRRQPELLQTLYSSPVWLTSAPPQAAPLGGDSSRAAGNGDNRLRLRDGRWLAYCDIGKADDLPVIMMHGISGSRGQRHPDDSLLGRYGIRLIIPDRPGSGDSDPLPQRRIIDWPQDVAALADHLGLDRFAVLGFSGGTSYALATGVQLRERVTRVSLVGCMPPFTHIEDLRHYLPAFRVIMLLARYAPRMLPPTLRVMVNGIRKNPQRYLDQVLARVTDADRAMFEDPRLRKAYLESLLASVKRGERDLARETLLAAQDWGFDLSAVQVPVTLWHGEGDRHVSIALAERIGQQLNAVALHRVAQAGHFILYSQWQNILAELGAAGTTTEPAPARVAGIRQRRG